MGRILGETVNESVVLSRAMSSQPYVEYIAGFVMVGDWGGSAPKLRVIQGILKIDGSWNGTAKNLKSIDGRRFVWGKFWIKNTTQ